MCVSVCMGKKGTNNKKKNKVEKIKTIEQKKNRKRQKKTNGDTREKIIEYLTYSGATKR